MYVVFGVSLRSGIGNNVCNFTIGQDYGMVLKILMSWDGVRTRGKRAMYPFLSYLSALFQHAQSRPKGNASMLYQEKRTSP